MRCFFLYNAECSYPNKQDQPDRRDNSMRGDIPFPAEGYDDQKIRHNKIIE